MDLKQTTPVVIAYSEGVVHLTVPVTYSSSVPIVVYCSLVSTAIVAVETRQFNFAVLYGTIGASQTDLTLFVLTTQNLALCTH